MVTHKPMPQTRMQSGGTIIECQKLLTALGAAHVSAYATHGVFPKESYKRFKKEGQDEDGGGFAHVWITDSCPQTSTAVEGLEPFEVLSLADPISAAIRV